MLDVSKTIWEIETRIRLLNPSDTKDELYSVFSKKIRHKYDSRHTDHYLFDPRLNDPLYFKRVREIDVTFPDSRKEKYHLLNEKKVLNSDFPPTKMGVRVAKERILELYDPGIKIERIIEELQLKSLFQVKGTRKSYELAERGINRDSIWGEFGGEFIECGIEIDVNDKRKIENYSRIIDGLVENLMERLEKVGVMTEIEPRIYPEINLLSKN